MNKFLIPSRQHRNKIRRYLKQKFPANSRLGSAMLSIVRFLRLWGVLRYPGEIADYVFPLERPVASVVIPTHNNAGLTIRCIDSIRSFEYDSAYEIIVVDDASSRFHRRRLRNLSGINRIELKKNQGYIEACNRGGDQARGEFLIMLNNDTLVTEGWLDALVRNFENPKVGLVGSRLVYPNGVLQEAGGLVFSDGSAANYGRGMDQFDPRFNYRRETDYCSGAAIAVRSALFRELGGYDRRYTRAYFEDTDLAMSIRALGFSVIYEPLSTIVHIEHASYSSAIGGTTDALMALNYQTFSEKWGSELKLYPPRDLTNLDATAQRRWVGKGTILVCDDFPRWKHDSGARRLREIIQAYLDFGYSVILVTVNPIPEIFYREEFARLGVQVWSHADPQLVDYLARIKNSIAFAHVARVNYARYFMDTLARTLLGVKFVFDTVDLNFLRLEREFELKKESMPRRHATLIADARRDELELMELADAVIVVSSEEITLLRELQVTTELFLVSNAHPDGVPPALPRNRKGILFVGNFNHAPNLDGLEWFLSEIHPRINAQTDLGELTVIGSPAPTDLIAKASTPVRALGWVEELEPHYDAARVVVAPLRFGAGVKGKIGEAWSFGVPVVMTGVGAEGMHVRHGETAFVADDPADFAGFVAEILDSDDVWMRLSTESQSHLRNNFSVAALRANLREVAKSLDSTPQESLEAREDRILDNGGTRQKP